MVPDTSPNNPIQEAVSLLETMRSYIHGDAALAWTSYQSVAEIHQELDACIAGILKLDKEAIDQAAMFFIPTGDFQNLALDSGWADEFLIFAERYDKLYVQLKALAAS